MAYTVTSLGSLFDPTPGIGFLSTAYGVSSDGSVIVGSAAEVDTQVHGFVYSDGVMTMLSDLPFSNPIDSIALAVSRDGTIWGGHSNDNAGLNQPVLWTAWNAI